jgi:hypothetical protein
LIKDATIIWDVIVEEGLLPGAEHNFDSWLLLPLFGRKKHRIAI